MELRFARYRMIFQSIKLLYILDLTPKERKAIFMASLGGLMEFYDFIIFGLMGVYFAQVILPHNVLGNWNIFFLFLIFIFGYMIRPFGMKLYSRCAIYYSSKTINIAVITALFISSLATGLIPTYSQAGIAGIVLLIAARILQGISSGAELQGEHDHLSIKIAYNHSFAILGFLAGNELGQLFGVVVYRSISLFLSEQEFNSFGWRLPFFIGSFLIAIVFMLRIRFGDPIYREYNRKAIMPSYKLLKTLPKPTLISIILSGIKGCSTFLYLVLIPFALWYYMHYNYLTISHIVFQSTIISIIFALLINPVINFNTAPKLATGVTALMPFIIFFWAWSFYHNKFILPCITLVAISSCLFNLTIPRVITGLFSPELRLYGVTFSHQNGFILFGGLAPLFNIAFGHLIFYFCNYQIDPALVFFIGVISYFFLIILLSLIALRSLQNHANYEDLMQISKITKNRHKRN